MVRGYREGEVLRGLSRSNRDGVAPCGDVDRAWLSQDRGRDCGSGNDIVGRVVNIVQDDPVGAERAGFGAHGVNHSGVNVSGAHGAVEECDFLERACNAVATGKDVHLLLGYGRIPHG